MSPFTNIVGNEKAIKAIKVFLLHPNIGSLLLVGEKGSGKSRLLKSIATICPTSLHCPPHIGNEQLLGSIHLEKTLKEGRMCRQEGLLERSDAKPILSEDIHRMNPKVFHTLMSHPKAKVAATLLEEDAQHLERMMDFFALIIRTESFSTVSECLQVLQANLDINPSRPSLALKLRKELETARKLLPQIFVSFPIKNGIVEWLNEIGYSNNQWEIWLLKTVCALAALDGRTRANLSDLKEAFELVIAERNLSSMQQGFPDSPEKKDESQAQDTQENAPSIVFPEDMLSASSSAEEKEEIFSIGVGYMPSMPEQRRRIQTSFFGSGRKERTRSTDQSGLAIGARPVSEYHDIDLYATLCCAAPHQRRRGYQEDSFFRIYYEDLQEKMRERGAGRQLLLLVDASGSLSVNRRMSEIKGAILSLLEEAYIRRDRVAMIAFRNAAAELVLPMTSSLMLAKKRLEELPCGGNTPLGLGLHKALEVEASLRLKQKDFRVKLYVISDGRANWSSGKMNAREEALRAARKLAFRGLDSFFVDYESARFPLGFMQQLAEEAGGHYVKVQEIKKENLRQFLRRPL